MLAPTYVPIKPPIPNKMPNVQSGETEIALKANIPSMEAINVPAKAVPAMVYTGRLKTDTKKGAIIAPPPIPYMLPTMPMMNESMKTAPVLILKVLSWNVYSILSMENFFTCTAVIVFGRCALSSILF